MIREPIDSGKTSLLSKSYARVIERVSGRPNETENGFAHPDEVIEARKASWARLFDKIEKVNDTTELNYLTLRPDDVSSGSEVSVRIPVRKSAAQIQYWIDTANAPCQVLELKGSDNESISISESEAEEPEEFKSSASGSMVAVKMPTDEGCDRGVASGSSFSSVDTATYIKSSANSARGQKRRRITSPGKLDNGKVGRCMNMLWPKVVVARLPDLNNKKKKTVEDVGIPCETASRVEEDLVREISGESLLSKRRKLYTGEKKLFDVEDLETVSKSRFGRMSLHPAMDSPSTFSERKSNKFGPRLLTTAWRQSRNNSMTKRFSRNRSTLFRTKTPKSTRPNLRSSKTTAKDSAKKSETVTETQNKEADSQNSIKLSPKEAAKFSTSTQPGNSSSVGSGDVSQMIKEDLNVDAKTQLSTVVRIKKLNDDSLSSKEGSMFKARGESRGDTAKNRRRNMMQAKKNLYKTLLKTSSDSESPASASPPKLKVGIECLKNSAQPRVILHDFFNLGECCGPLERESNEYWSRRKGENAISMAEDKENQENKENCPLEGETQQKGEGVNAISMAENKGNQENKENGPSEGETKQKVPSRKKKLKSERKLKSSKRSRSRKKLYITRFDFATDSSTASEKPAVLQIVKGNETKEETSKDNVTFTNTKHDQYGSFIVQSSSEDENIFQVLASISKPKSKSKDRDNEESKTSRNMENTRLDASKSIRTVNTLTIVSSSSEKEETPVETTVKTQQVTRKDVQRKKRLIPKKNAIGSESSDVRSDQMKIRDTGNRLKITSGSSTKGGNSEAVSEPPKVSWKYFKRRKDGTQSTNKLEGPEGCDGESKRQLRSLEKSSGKKEGERDILSASNKVNSKNMKDRMSRNGKLNGKSKNSEILISEDENDADKVAEVEMNEKQIVEDKTNPVDRELEKKPDKIGKKKTDSRIEDDRDSELTEKSMKYGDEERIKNSAKMVEGGRKVATNRLSTLVLDFSDESSVNDDTMIFTQKSYAGSNSIEDSTRTTDSRSPRRSRKRSRKPRATSTVVYRTKESWETDSDNF